MEPATSPIGQYSLLLFFCLTFADNHIEFKIPVCGNDMFGALPDGHFAWLGESE
jgi:hypothetical protein